MTKDAILGLVRHLLTFGVGFLAAQGFASADEVNTAIAALVTLVGIAWSIIDKRSTQPTA